MTSALRVLLVLLTASVTLACSARRSEPTSAVAPDTRTIAPKLSAVEAAVPPAPAELLEQESIDWEHNQVMRTIRRMTEQMKETHYVHGIEVHVKKGYFAFDCSGMVDWLLRGATPVARRSLQRGLESRPLARDFVQHLAVIEPGQERGGWLRIARIADARPGDVIAWLKPKIVHSANTGHVAIIMLEPRPRAAGDSAYLVRVADASRLMHEDDTRHGKGGYGIGTILIETHPVTGVPSGFHFGGSRAEFALGTKIVIGRPLR